MGEANKLRERAAAALSLAKMEQVKDQRAPLIVLASIWIETAERMERQGRKTRKTVRDLYEVLEGSDARP